MKASQKCGAFAFSIHYPLTTIHCSVIPTEDFSPSGGIRGSRILTTGNWWNTLDPAHNSREYKDDSRGI